MKAQELLAKAVRAAASAQVLLDIGDLDGACNRAYYAMYDAARAALSASDSAVEAEAVDLIGDGPPFLSSAAVSVKRAVVQERGRK